ncbi:MAG: ATP-binding protein [Candidatus Margulisbacteria bacterium]|nr:ATP-binding protein [Candidatus Margulisiibacteriota bacterium]MBU1617670.1 ATP-binding protein [Candidatus Margulisiibacteriota bacterium]
MRVAVSDFVAKRRELTPAALARTAVERLQSHGAIYVTGEMYSRTARDQSLALEYNAGIGKTTWFKNELTPLLLAAFGQVCYFNLEEIIPINEIMGGKLPAKDARDCFDQVRSLLVAAGETAQVIALDECHWLFPAIANNTEKAGNLEIFRFGPSYSPKQSAVWETIDALLARDKKLVFISWLHPRDLSLASTGRDPNFATIFSAPLFEFEKWEDDDG